MHFSEEGTFINAESRFEYRILLHLSNGTTIEQSAGQAGFLPNPVHLDSKTAYLNDTMVSSRPTEDNKHNYDPAPECVSSCADIAVAWQACALTFRTAAVLPDSTFRSQAIRSLSQVCHISPHLLLRIGSMLNKQAQTIPST